MEIRKFIFKRLIEILVIFFIILTVLFVLLRLSPGDPISRIVDPNMTPEDAQRLIAQLGLNQPIWVQYG
jgi:peptide/nickel transport system permease protein